ncbi:MAG: LamG-like jellyroll fold domain-containing protein, partial [Nocardioidaceae bacterium]
VRAFKARVNLRVESLARSGKNLIIAGRFIRVNGKLRASLAAVSLSKGKLTSWSPNRVCATCTTYWDVVVDDARAYVASSGPGGNVGAYDLSSGKRNWLVHADGDVQALAIAPDGLLYLGGHFNQFVGNAGQKRHQLAAVRPATGKVNRKFHPHMVTPYPGVWALAATSTRLYAGGSFTGVRSQGTNNNEPYLAMFGPSLRGKWALNETSGTVAHDSSGLGHHGHIYSAQLGEPGKQGLAYGFGANQARIEVPTHPDLNPGWRDFAFSAYVNFTTAPGAGGTYDVIRKGLSFTAGGEYKLEIVHSGSVRCIAKDSTGLTARIPARTTSLADGRWHRIGCSLVGSTWSVLVDGQTRSKTVPLKKISNISALAIGSKYGQQDGTPGRIDEVQLTIG